MTICALSSASGSSGVAVIRISGPETKNLIKKLIKKVRKFYLFTENNSFKTFEDLLEKLYQLFS